MKPDPNKKHPIPGYEKEIYVKPTITNPNGDQCLLLSILFDLFTEALIVHMYLSFLNQID